MITLPEHHKPFIVLFFIYDQEWLSDGHLKYAADNGFGIKTMVRNSSAELSLLFN